MKRLLMAICALCLTLNCVKAQNSNQEEPLLGGLSIEYQAIENAFAAGFNIVYNHFGLLLSMVEGETNSYVTKNSGWRVGAGYNYRYWLNKSVYVEGTAGVEYSHSKVEYKEGEGEKGGNFGLFATPKVGIKLFKWDDTDWGIQAGYRWDFNKFKFSKEYTADYFTVGIVGIF